MSAHIFYAIYSVFHPGNFMYPLSFYDYSL